MLITRTGKGIFRDMFDVAAVRLTEASGRDRKYGIGPFGGYGAVGGRVCDRHQKIFNLMSSLSFSSLDSSVL